MTTTTVPTAALDPHDPTTATPPPPPPRAGRRPLDAGLGPITYRPGAGPDTGGLVFYAVISVRGRLTIVAATPDDAPLSRAAPAHRDGEVRRCPLGEGITAWASADVAVDDAATQVAAG